MYERPTGPPPECRCGHPTTLMQSHTERNPNRWFYKCANPGGGCNYFKWADQLQGSPAQGPPQQQQQQQDWRSPQQPQQQAGPSHHSQGIPRYAEAPAGPSMSPGQQQGPAQGCGGYAQQQGPPAAAAAGGGGSSGMMYGPGGGPQQQQQHYQSPQQQPPGGYGGAYNSPGPQQPQQQWQQWQQQQGYNDGAGGGSQGGSLGGSQQQQQYSQPQQQYSQPQQPQYSQPQQQWQQVGQQGWQPSPQQQQQPWDAISPQQQWQQPMQQQGVAGVWQGHGAVNQSPMQQQQQPMSQGMQQSPYKRPPAWPASPQQTDMDAAMGHSTQQQHTPGRNPAAAAAAASGSPAPSPKQQHVRVIDVPGEPDLVAFKVAYDRAFVDAIKETPFPETGRAWDHVAKVWRVKRSAMETVIRHLTSRGFKCLRPGEKTPGKQQGAAQGNAEAGSAHIDLEALEKSNAVLVELKPLSVAQELVGSLIPRETWEALLPHQQEGVLAGVRRSGRLLLADEMGLGKTAQAITLAACYPADWPLLVVCPTSLLSNWAVELEAWLPPTLKADEGRPRTLIIRSDKDKKRLLGAGLPAGAHILLTTYKMVQGLPQQTLSRYGVVICDESHKLKEPTTQQSRFVGSIVRGARRAFLLTGTPLLSRPIEAWPQVDMLRPNLCGTYDDFGKKYCTLPNSPAAGGSGGGRGWRPKYMGSNRDTADELHRLLLANVMVRRTKGQSGVTLPDKTRLKVSVSVSADSQPQLSFIRSAMDALQAQGATDSPEAQNLVNEYRMATGEAKVDSVIDFIRSLPGLQTPGTAAAAAAGNGGDSDGEAAAAAAAAAAGDAQAGPSSGSSSVDGRGKVLVFAHHHNVLDAIQSKLCEADGLGYVRIDGRTSGPERQAAVSSFQNDVKVRIALMSIKAAGVGLTLTAADTVVFGELDWNPTDLMQCEDRVHRVGQKRHCTIYYCVAPKSADMLMWGTLVRKLRIVGAAVDGRVWDAKGLSNMQYWQQVGSQQLAGVGATEGGEEGLNSQQNRSRDAGTAAAASGGTSHAASAGTSGAAAGAGAGSVSEQPSARRSLFGEFLDTGRLPGGTAPGSGVGGAGGSAVTGATAPIGAPGVGSEGVAGGSVVTGATAPIGAPGAASEGVAAGSQGDRTAQAHNNTQGGAAAASAGPASQPAAGEGPTPPESNDWVIVNAAGVSAGAPAAAAAGPATQGSQLLSQPGSAAAATGGASQGGNSSQQQSMWQAVSSGRLAAVCAAVSSQQVGQAGGGANVEATGSAPDAPASGSPAEDPAAKRQRQA